MTKSTCGGLRAWCVLLALSPLAGASPAPSASGAEQAWVRPPALLTLDLEHHARAAVPPSPALLSKVTWLAVPIQAGETYLWRTAQPDALEFALLAGDEFNGVTHGVTPRRVSANEVLYQAVAGPPALLLVRKRGEGSVSVQAWLLAESSPGYRWELWELAVREWARTRAGPPPPAPAAGTERLTQSLELLQGALEDTPEVGLEAARALTSASALLLDLPYREPIFPYFTRRDVKLLSPLPVVATPRGEAVRLEAGEVADLEVEGPGLLRVDAQAFGPPGRKYRGSFDLLLDEGDRPVAAAYEVASTPLSLGELAFSTQRRLLWSVPPGRHQVSLRSRGAGTAFRAYVHRRLGRAEELVTREADIAQLLKRAGEGSKAGLVTAEALYQAGALADAAAAYAALPTPLGPRARALVEVRRLQLTPLSQPLVAPVLPEGEGSAEVEVALLAAQLRRGLASLPSASVSTRVPLLAVAALRGTPGMRAKSLEVLGAAVAQAPLDEPLRERLQREWWSGARWSTLPIKPGAGAWRANVLAPAVELSSCSEARERGSPAYLEPATQELALTVSAEAAPEGSLHRYHLLARTQGLAEVAVELDGQAQRIPVGLPQQRLSFALAAGDHSLRLGTTGPVRVFVPCSIAPASLSGEALIEQEYAVLGADGSVAAALLDPGTAATVAVELRARPSELAQAVRVQVDDGEPMTVQLRTTTVDPRAVGAQLGPPLQALVPVSSTATQLTVSSVSGDAPVYVRLLMRRSLGAPRLFAPRAMRAQATPVELEALRTATREVQAAPPGEGRALKRMDRAQLLLSLDQVTLGRRELEQALPQLAPADAEQARALVAASAEPPLLPSGGARSKVLASAAGVVPTPEERACLGAALSAGKAAGLRACPGASAAYFAGLLAEQEGEPLAAAGDLMRAFTLSKAPAFAREAAQRLALAGPAHAVEALALATLAEQAGDFDAGRIAARVRIASRSRPVRAVEAGPAVRVAAETPPTPSLRAALADVGWVQGTFLELHPGKAAEFALQVERPIEVELETQCDLAGAAQDEGPPCELETELDGQRLGEVARVSLASTRTVAKVRLLAGSHRFHLTLTPAGEERTGFVRVVTDRQLIDGSPTRALDGRFILPIRPPPEHRFAATVAKPVKLQVQGPTLLRIEALFEPGEARALAISLGKPDGTIERQNAIACRTPQEALRASKPFDCGAVITVPVALAGRVEVTVWPVGAPRAAISLGLREPLPELRTEAEPAAAPAQLAPPVASVAVPSPLSTSTLAMVPTVPAETALNHLGSLRLEQLGYLGGDSLADPRVGDRFAETSVTYRQRLPGLPVWLMGSAWLHLHPRGAPLVGGELFGFARLPGSHLRIYLDVKAVTERVGDTQQASARFYGYLERSFEVLPRLYLLPRLAFATSTRSLTQLPPLKLGDVMASPEVDPAVFSSFDQHRPRRVYAQLLTWWVPFVNAIVYLQLRPYLAPSLVQLDTLSARLGFDVALGTTEVIGSYEYQRLLPGELRRRSGDVHRLALELQHTLWLNREQRLGFRLGGRFDPVNQSSSLVFGLFWEGSGGHGLDDYSTPEVNLPDQIAQGRGLQQREESLR